MVAPETEEDAAAIHRGLAGVCFDETRITDIQGQRGELRYRGYGIDELVIDPSYERTAYLLLHGEWPTPAEHRVFCASLATNRSLSATSIGLIESIRSASPTVALRTAVSCLGSEQSTGSLPLAIGLELVARLPSLVAAHHELRTGRVIGEPDPSLDHATDFLRRLLGRAPTVLERRIINLDFVLHADHGANASAFAARVVASTEADMIGAVTAGVAALAGPLHGGAVAAVSAMLAEIEAPEQVPELVASRRQRGLPIYGFGHRVYRRRDPRAEHYRNAARELAAAAGDDHLIAVTDALIDAMAPYRRMGIDANDDLYAAVVYRLLGLPDDLATGIFAAGRVVGWVAHVLEQQQNNILIRPRLRYVGAPARGLSRVGTNAE